MSAKLIGYLVYKVFTGTALPLSVIHTSGLSLNLMSPKDLDQLTNITLTYLLYSFLVSVGFKLASLGSQFLRAKS